MRNYMRNKLCTVRNCNLNRCAPNAHLFFPLMCHHAWLFSTQPHIMHGRGNYTHASQHGYPSFSRALVGPPLQKPLVRPSVRPCPENKPYLLCRRMRPLTWLSQILDRSARTPVISKSPRKTSRQLTMAAGTNEVALWAPQLYIVPFSKLPRSVTGAQSLCFLIHLQPWDQDPPPTQSHSLGHHPYWPRGSIFFSHITSRYACSCSKLSNNCHMFFIFRYCSRRVFSFNVCRYLVITTQRNPFRYMINTSM
jgi:hypothetical protein